MARSTFYYNTRPRSDRWAAERVEVAKIFHEHRGRYGYRRITDEMRARGYAINHKTVQKLTEEAGAAIKVSGVSGIDAKSDGGAAGFAAAGHEKAPLTEEENRRMEQ